jgi:hypothetical protein
MDGAEPHASRSTPDVEWRGRCYLLPCDRRPPCSGRGLLAPSPRRATAPPASLAAAVVTPTLHRAAATAPGAVASSRRSPCRGPLPRAVPVSGAAASHVPALDLPCASRRDAGSAPSRRHRAGSRRLLTLFPARAAVLLPRRSPVAGPRRPLQPWRPSRLVERGGGDWGREEGCDWGREEHGHGRKAARVSLRSGLFIPRR